MLKASPLLLIGLTLFLWARGMTHDDLVTVGLGKAGHIELRSATAAVSASASPGLHKLGRQPLSFEFTSRQIKSEAGDHHGFRAQFKTANNWNLRIPLLGVMAVFIFGLVILAKWAKPW